MTALAPSTVTPRLVVEDATGAIEFYKSVFEADEVSRFTDEEDRIVHCELRVGESTFAITSASEHNEDPAKLGGSSVILDVTADDPDAIEAEAVARGAEVIFPVDDRNYGRRDGRFQDPFGHLWIVGKPIDRPGM